MSLFSFDLDRILTGIPAAPAPRSRSKAKARGDFGSEPVHAAFVSDSAISVAPNDMKGRFVRVRMKSTVVDTNFNFR